VVVPTIPVRLVTVERVESDQAEEVVALEPRAAKVGMVGTGSY
jgi:hypothetical protein